MDCNISKTKTFYIVPTVCVCSVFDNKARTFTTINIEDRELHSHTYGMENREKKRQKSFTHIHKIILYLSLARHFDDFGLESPVYMMPVACDGNIYTNL